jgi:hypothetical protein
MFHSIPFVAHATNPMMSGIDAVNELLGLPRLYPSLNLPEFRVDSDDK